MSATGSEPCCSNPAALVVVAALPLCQAQMMLDDPYSRYLEEAGIPDVFVGVPEIPLVGGDGEDLFPESAFAPAPYRCACLMDCADAIALMQEVGHVEL